ncbi:hypothetical protein V6N13_037780 [Hibiscus sabdariffa]|uniref:Uncharacterized protein n=1 Tax=Hibiscus sabdariffa TaxID=183260 RepID=A0ABR2S427_9ROSI
MSANWSCHQWRTAVDFMESPETYMAGRMLPEFSSPKYFRRSCWDTLKGGSKGVVHIEQGKSEMLEEGKAGKE